MISIAFGALLAFILTAVFRTTSVQGEKTILIDELMIQATTLQKQIQELQQVRLDPGLAKNFASVGSLIRSIPAGVMVIDFDNQLQLIVAQRWFHRYAIGNTVQTLVLMDHIVLDEKAPTITATMVRAGEFYDAVPVTVSLECHFAVTDVETLARLARGEPVRVRGTLSSVGFCKGTTKHAKVMFMVLGDCKIEESKSD